MDITGKSVRHKKFGTGSITAINSDTISINFNGKERKFALNGVFISLLVGNDETVELLKQCVSDNESKIYAEKCERLSQIENKISKARAVLSHNNQRQESSGFDIAVNLVYCDGGKNESTIGFNGVCSDDVLEENVSSADDRWCTQRDCRCGVYAENKSTATRRELDRLMEDGGFVCPESRLLRDWVICAGTENDRTPRRLNTSCGRLCVLTTVEKGSSEDKRCIFALYIIENIDEDINGISQLWAESYYRYTFSPEHAAKMLFWDFAQGGDEPEWGDDRFIYLNNEISLKILTGAAELTGDKKLYAMLDYYKDINGCV